VELPIRGINTGAGPKNISRHWWYKANRFPVSAAGFTMGKCGLLPQHFHRGVNVAGSHITFISASSTCNLYASEL